jgi:hypothetical protein
MTDDVTQAVCENCGVTKAEADLIGWYLRDNSDSDDFTITIARKNGRWHAQLDSGDVCAGHGLTFDEAWAEAMKEIGGLVA